MIIYTFFNYYLESKSKHIFFLILFLISRSLKWDNMQKELENFATMAQSCKGGRIRIEEFASFLKMPISPVLQELFALFDRVCVCAGLFKFIKYYYPHMLFFL